MKRPELSIIIPVYNCEQDIARCLWSIKRQKGFDQYEVILVDDCSTDNTPMFLELFASSYKNVKLISHKENAGVSVARNTGIAASTGGHLTFVDPDDEVGLSIAKFNEYFKEPTYHEVIDNLDYKESYVPLCLKNKPIPTRYFTDTYFINMLNAAKNTDAEVILGGQIIINNDINCIVRQAYDKGTIYGKAPEDKDIILKQAELRESANFALYKRSLLDGHNLRFLANMRNDGDMLFCMLAVLYAEKVATIPDVTYFYNRHLNSISNISDPMEFKRKFAIANIQRYSVLLKELSKYPEYARIFNTYMGIFAANGQMHQYKKESFPPKQCIDCASDKCTGCKFMNPMSALIQQNIELYTTKTM